MKISGLRIYIIFTIFLFSSIHASLSDTTKYIMVDQFGYRPNDQKVAVIADPQIGFNASDSFTPGPLLELRDWNSGEVIFSGSPVIWNNGATHQQSGDKGWWFDFSSVKKEGSYYLYDPTNRIGSYKFEINENVYFNLLKAAFKMFFYNRCSIEKKEPFADPNWKDGPSFYRNGQDKNAKYIDNKTDVSLQRDVSGGWFDAGDFNKYVTFAETPVHQLLDAYAENKFAWSDSLDIPESGNGIPDILDEVMWELDWIKRMQDTTDGGVYIKAGSITYNLGSPPSSDLAPRYYGPKCSSSSIASAGMFAHAAFILKDFPALKNYFDDLVKRAEKAWNWFNTNPIGENCDTLEIKSGDADRSAITAAVYLFAVSEKVEYNNYFLNNYKTAEQINWWGPYNVSNGDALLFYTTLSKADVSAKTFIRDKFINQGAGLIDFFRFYSNKDLYRSHMPDNQYHWGSLNVKGNMGCNNYNFIVYGYDAANKESYLEKAASTLHYFHGVNPLNKVYLTNMSKYGAENSVDEIYHGWFKDGSVWDNAKTSKYGPAPGYIPGGPNKAYGGSEPGLKDQPAQKAYKDGNGYNNPWEITEPAIYYQSAYIKLLSKFVDTRTFVSVKDTKMNLPASFGLLQNYPNPFNPETIINYHIPSINKLGAEINSIHVTLRVYDILGREIITLVDEEQQPGVYRTVFDARNLSLSSDIYFYSLQAGDCFMAKKMLFLK